MTHDTSTRGASTDNAAEPRRVYLDNAATSWPKPEGVYQAVDDYLRNVGAPAGRAGYAEAVEVGSLVADARRQIARLLGVDDPRRVIFGLNGTDALNLAIHGLLADGDHVVTTDVEHNSVLRPLAAWELTRRITVTRVPCDDRGVVDPAAIGQALKQKTRLVAVSHASNVTGAVQDVAAIARLAHDAGALVLCDAAQTVGHVAVDMAALGVDLLAASGHKGLLGPLGTGVLAIAAHVPSQLASVRQGGTGTESESELQPDALPSKYESGNLNVAGIAGLRAGIAYLAERGIANIAEHGRQLTDLLLTGLAEIAAVRVVGPRESAARVPLVSIVVEGYDPQEMALALDASCRVQVRAGLHCAPRVHERVGALAGGGTVRLSLGPFTTAEDIEIACRAVADLAASPMTH
jgi:cysteine desulfurase family protein